MARSTKRGSVRNRATNRPGDSSPFAMGLLFRRAHHRASSALVEAMRPYGLELRHFAVLIVLSDQGPGCSGTWWPRPVSTRPRSAVRSTTSRTPTW